MNVSEGISPREVGPERITYSAATSGFAMAASPTDVWNIIGSSTKIIRIKKVKFTGTTSSGSPIAVSAALIKRSTANTAGTRVTASMVPHDSANGAATANVGHYTANPSALGTAVGTVRCTRVAFTQSGVANEATIDYDFNSGGSEPIILRGTSEQLCLNMNATSVTGSAMCVSCEWEEVDP